MTTFDQAIFTSVRSPMGEGYRVIAASKGVRPEEKQFITRCSPSHNGLCVSATSTADAGRDICGAAFYRLPTGRLCVAVSSPAGAEHTGRGGQKVYTHNLLMSVEDFARWQHNPFHVLRAMVKAGMHEPCLKPPTTLPDVEWAEPTDVSMPERLDVHEALVQGCGGRTLVNLLNGNRVIVNLDDHWVETAEAILLGIPSSMRADVSLTAGLVFSVGRTHQLVLLADRKGTLTRKRLTGQSVEFLESGDSLAEESSKSAWLEFVSRHWLEGRWQQLALRTARPLRDPGTNGRECIGRIYNDTDAVSSLAWPKLTAMASEYLSRAAAEDESELINEFLNAAQRELVQRCARASWSELSAHWHGLTQFFQTGRGAEFALPVVERALRVSGATPLDVAGGVLDVARTGPVDTIQATWKPIEEAALQQLITWSESAPSDQLDRLFDLCEQFQTVRPGSEIVTKLAERCTALREAREQSAGSTS